MKGTRLDVALHQRGLADSRERAKSLILAGDVLVDGQVVDRAATLVEPEATLELRAEPPFVSRGGLKLAHALDEFGLEPAGWVVADAGASTGGFTDCLLQRGAARVYAIDVGYGQLAWALRQDPRVVVMERTNARYLESLPELVALVVMDVSFISVLHILPRVRGWLAANGQVVTLIKPQFEAGREQVGKGGVVRDHAVHRAVLEQVLGRALAEGWTLRGLTVSPITGPKGNIEFLAWLAPTAAVEGLDLECVIRRTIDAL